MLGLRIEETERSGHSVKDFATVVEGVNVSDRAKGLISPTFEDQANVSTF